MLIKTNTHVFKNTRHRRLRVAAHCGGLVGARVGPGDGLCARLLMDGLLGGRVLAQGAGARRPAAAATESRVGVAERLAR